MLVIVLILTSENLTQGQNSYTVCIDIGKQSKYTLNSILKSKTMCLMSTVNPIFVDMYIVCLYYTNDVRPLKSAQNKYAPHVLQSFTGFAFSPCLNVSDSLKRFYNTKITCINTKNRLYIDLNSGICCFFLINI